MKGAREEEAFEKRLVTAFAPYLRLAEELVSVAEEMAEARPVLLNSAFDGLSAFFFSKSHKTFSAVLVLASKGFGEDAAVLCRGLAENAINFLYIREEPIRRADLYLEYEYVLRHMYLETLEAAGVLEGLAASDGRQRVRELYESVKRNYPNRHLWSGRSLREMAEEVGLSAHYRFAYKYFSDVAHGAPSTILQVLRPTEEPGFVRVEFGPTENLIKEALIWSSDLFWRILVAYDQVFSLGMQGRLQDVAQRMRSLFGTSLR
ncbi:MAG: hypothetical protein C4521_04010 [Actinobacteria bacterium]|nr:MAG: hypothetical protein C4521_04010 [Actinomycetota bacterium]